MTVNEFISYMRNEFGSIEYKATSVDGKVYKSKEYDKREKDISSNGSKQKRCDFFDS